MSSIFLQAFLGGALIGLGAILLMITNGRIAGISGILQSAATSMSRANGWRWSFIIGLIIAPVLTGYLGFRLPSNLPVDIVHLSIAGFIVGIGTQIGSGCTSGHGICGIGRLSSRSIVATITFMSVAILTVTLVRHVI